MANEIIANILFTLFLIFQFGCVAFFIILGWYLFGFLVALLFFGATFPFPLLMRVKGKDYLSPHYAATLSFQQNRHQSANVPHSLHFATALPGRPRTLFRERHGSTLHEFLSEFGLRDRVINMASGHLAHLANLAAIPHPHPNLVRSLSGSRAASSASSSNSQRA